MDRALGLLLLTIYIVAIVGLAALVTYVVIRLFPTKDTPSKPDEPKADGGSSNGGSSSGGSSSGQSGGRLYRRAKRGSA